MGRLLLLWMEIENSEIEWNVLSAEKRTSFHIQSEIGSSFAYVLLLIHVFLQEPAKFRWGSMFLFFKIFQLMFLFCS